LGEKRTVITNPQSARPQAAYTRPVEPYTRTGVTEATYEWQAKQGMWARVLQDLRALRNLRNNWDADGSDAPSQEIIETAIRFAGMMQSREFELPETAVASRAGTVLFGWRRGSCYQEIEVVAKNRLEWMQIDEFGKSTHGQFSLPEESVAPVSTTPFWQPQKLSA
jgi:hypothetical protein